MIDLKAASDEQIRAKLKELAATEKRVSVELIRHLVEYDKRDLYRSDLVANLWEYRTTVLGLSEDQAGLRIRVARAVRESPSLGTALENGELSVSAVRRLAPALRVAVGQTLVERARGQSLREVERITAAALADAATVQERVARAAMEARPPAPAMPDGDSPAAAARSGANPPAAATTPEPDASAPRRSDVAELVRNPDLIRPVSADDWRVTFVAASAFVRNLELVRNLLARRHPRARLEDVLGASLELLLDRIDPRRRNARRNAKRALRRIPTVSGGIPRTLRDAVIDRDGHRCAFELDGVRCPVQRFLEVDHIVPVSLGGATTLANLRALCRGHHVIVTELTFGEAFIAQAIATRRALTMSAHLAQAN